MRNIDKHTDLGVLILRMSVGMMLLVHGITKLIQGVGWIKMMLEKVGLPTFVAYGVYVGEVLAPIMLIVGFKTRFAAIIIIFNMLMAIAMVHGKGIFTLGATGGWSIELPALYLFSVLALLFTGPGRYSIDR